MESDIIEEENTTDRKKRNKEELADDDKKAGDTEDNKTTIKNIGSKFRSGNERKGPNKKENKIKQTMNAEWKPKEEKAVNETTNNNNMKDEDDMDDADTINRSRTNSKRNKVKTPGNQEDQKGEDREDKKLEMGKRREKE